ncbi:SDR family NAD(P)-dependent oxidoreductase, partial [Streptomyces megasporus]|uniref:SDR family NAD(P)-dependent oxidoreductase n=1 Tax=Streptomyces megasporus TaxID=44060 RepID=UPI0012FE9E4A
MRIDLSGRTALVTGSTGGIGAAIAGGLARAGARVAVNGRREESVAAAAERLRAEVPGAEVVEVAADVTTEDGAARVVEKLPEVDVLINNLGIFGPRPAPEITDDEWRRYRVYSQCTGLQPGGEANLRTALTSAVCTDPHCSPEPGSERPVLLLDVLLHDAERRAADGP